MDLDIHNYFEEEASRYRQRSGSFLWNWQRSREASAINALMGEVRGHTLLDLGSGSGYYTEFFLSRGAHHVVAVDFSQSMINTLPTENVTGHVGDAAAFDIAARFSRIVCAGLLEFVPDPRAVLANARRLINDRGHLVCLVPPENWAGRLYRGFHKSHGFRINLFNDEDTARIAQATGWRIDAHRAVFPYTCVYRLFPMPLK
jgi:ubiquinone/menaquinone biosynthesis C-methylase UbiE